MTVKDFYNKITERIPEKLRCDWDNDGIMCCSDSSAEVNSVLITLDVTEEIVDYAIERGFDLIISHHPLIFKSLGRLTEENHISRKAIKLISNNVSVFSFHTRADKVCGGVNDILARKIGLTDITSFGDDLLGRIGTLPEEMTIEDFCYTVKESIGSDCVRYADAYNPVKRVALVGGDGKDYVNAALAAGADTYISGRISYNIMEEASDMGINLVEAGHYHTEFPVTDFFAKLVSAIDGNITIEIADSNMIKII